MEMKLYKSSFVQWLGYLALTEETGVQFPYEENFFNYYRTLTNKQTNRTFLINIIITQRNIVVLKKKLKKIIEV